MKRPLPLQATRAALTLCAALAALPSSGAAPPAAAKSPPRCDRCQDIARLEKELAQQKAARDAFREFTYDATGKRRMVSSIEELQAEHAALFAVIVNGGRPGKGGRGRVVARPSLGTAVPDCKLVEYVAGSETVTGKDGKPKTVKKSKEIPFDEAKFRQKECPLIADYLIGHEQKHVSQCRRSVEQGLVTEWNNPLFVAESEVKAYQAGIDILEMGLSKLRAQCGVAMSGPAASPNQALASAPDLPSLQREAQRAAEALKKGWS